MDPNEFFKLTNDSGIYYLRNKLNGKYYIGQADKLRKRLRHHVSNVNTNRYDNPIYRALRKYGWENFEWGILEIFTDELYEDRKKKLDEAEIFYIKKYNSYGATGYNQTHGGDGGIEGYKFTQQQKDQVSKNSTKTSHDGRNKIYYYDIETKEYGEELALSDFNKKIGITTRHLETLLIKNRYIVARTKEKLEEKIEKYNSRVRTGINSKRRIIRNPGMFTSKLTEEMIEDIKNDIRAKDFCVKYSVCRKTYHNYKNQIYKELGRSTKRVYQRKFTMEEYKEYRKNNTRQETAEHFDISVDYTYDCDRKMK